jgi:hypothetical protein
MRVRRDVLRRPTGSRINDPGSAGHWGITNDSAIPYESKPLVEKHSFPSGNNIFVVVGRTTGNLA